MATINNSAARIWTKTQMNKTVKQCKANNFFVEKDSYGMITVTDTINCKTVLCSIPMNNKNLVRIDISYFK